jgi:hypothetical protein
MEAVSGWYLQIHQADGGMKHDQLPFGRSLKLGRKTPGVKSIPYLFCIFIPKGYYHKTIVIYAKSIVKSRSRGLAISGAFKLVRGSLA